MNSEEFVDAVKKYVSDAAVAGVRQVLLAPPGRQPAASLVKSSQWYNSLPTQDQEQVMTIAADAIHSAIFGFLCVLDGCSTIDDSHFEFRLFSVSPNDETTTQLSGSEENDMLHELYNSL